MDTEALLKLQIEEGFNGIQVEVIFSPVEYHEQLRQQAAAINQVATQFYFPRGIVPITEDPENECLFVAFCLPIIMEQCSAMDEATLIKYVMYWITRIKLRIVREMDFAEESGDDHMIEEMVEADLTALGMPRWWEDLLV